jgi:hypothetical protein
MKPRQRTDHDLLSRQQEAKVIIKRPQFTSNFTADNKLFYLYLDIIKQK